MEFKRSGLTRQAFCSEHGLSVSSLDKYRRQARESEPGRMVPIEVLTDVGTAAAGRRDCSGALWLESPNGWRIWVGSGFDAATLGRLLTDLEQV
jgi:hypothetical protein